MNKTKMMTLIAGVALVATMSGCAQAGNADETGTPGINSTAMAAPTAQEMQDGAALYMQLATTIYGSGIDRWNAGRVQAYKIEKAKADCLAEHGFTHNIEPYSTSGAAPIMPGDGYWEFTEIRSDFGYAYADQRSHEIHQGYSNPGYDGLDEAGKKRWHEILNSECAADEANMESDLYNSHIPASLAEADQAFEEQALSKAHLDPKVDEMRGEYGACVKERGFDVPHIGELRVKVAEAFPASASGPHDPSVSVESDAWQTAARMETDAASADTACRQEMFSYAVGLAHPDLVAFSQNNTELLARITNEWNAMRAEAVTLFG